MALQLKATMKEKTSSQSPTDNQTITIDVNKVIARIQTIVKSYPEKFQPIIELVFSAIIADKKFTILETQQHHNMAQIIINLIERVIIESDGNIVQNITYNAANGDVAIIMPAIQPFKNEAEIFINPYPVSNVVIKYSRLVALRQYLKDIEFADDARKKMFEIAMNLQSTIAVTEFKPQKIYNAINIIKAHALISGNKKVNISNLIVLAYIWNDAAMAAEYMNSVENIILNFNGIAEKFGAELIKIRNTFNNARNAAASPGVPINYWDNTIPETYTLDDVIVECLNKTSLVESELIALTDGKNPNNKSHAALFSILKDATDMKRTFAGQKGIKQ